MIIRRETSEDIKAIGEVNDQAFGRKVEGEIVARLRGHGALVLSLVAVEGEGIIGHIAFSPMEIQPESSVKAIALGPIAVLPSYQRRGIGSELMKAGLDECREMGYEAVFLVGHAEYYPRFGFVRASSKGIKFELEVPDEAWMVLELQEGALTGRQGTAVFQPEFREAA